MDSALAVVMRAPDYQALVDQTQPEGLPSVRLPTSEAQLSLCTAPPSCDPAQGTLEFGWAW